MGMSPTGAHGIGREIQAEILWKTRRGSTDRFGSETLFPRRTMHAREQIARCAFARRSS